jgi:hypothetical protein
MQPDPAVKLKPPNTAFPAHDGDHFNLFQVIPEPGEDITAWVALLDGALPPHLRSPLVTPPVLTLSAMNLAEILITAQYPRSREREGFDLLYHLGVEQGRWSAVVWLVKKLIDKLPLSSGQNDRLAKLGTIWPKTPRLDDLTQEVIELDGTESSSLRMLSEPGQLDEITRRPRYRRDEVLGHNAIGQIWRTLAAMTKSCAGGDIRPEVLEIIAYLHHRELMPTAIYQAEPHGDKCAVQQPPLIPLLSSRILTSLSDAAWRAHEKLVTEEAKANGTQYAALRPEIPGSVFRVHVTGLRPEVWLELILWSCLYGGWVRQGTEILLSVIHCRPGETPWRAISWQQYEQQLPPETRGEPGDWTAWEYMFKTTPASAMDSAPAPKQTTTRTVSGEVLNAYVDALTSSTHVGVGARGIRIDTVLHALTKLRKFLFANKLSLSFGTWDALILRLLDSRSIIPELDSGMLQDLVALSSGFGQSISNPNTQDLPAYTLDSSLAIQGLLHRALLGQIHAESFEGALEIFTIIQQRADGDKIKSIRSFFLQQGRAGDVKPSFFQALASAPEVPPIDYPAFHVQIPPPILGSFLDLATEARAFEFGMWLLDSKDVDGPVIRLQIYQDRYIHPALIRFAAESNDSRLLHKLASRYVGRDSLRAVLDIHISKCNWDAAVKVLDNLATTRGTKWSDYNLANLISAMLQLDPASATGSSKTVDNFHRAKVLVTEMVRFEREGEVPSRDRMATVQSILCVLAAVSPTWAAYAGEQRLFPRHHKFEIRTSVFNALLKGAVAAYGSAAGRQLLHVLWPPAVRRAYDAKPKLGLHEAARSQMPRYRPLPFGSAKRQRVVIKLPQGSRRAKAGAKGGENLVFYGGVSPNTNTIMIVLRKALQELVEKRQNTDEQDGEEDEESLREVLSWAIKYLVQLPYVQPDVLTEIDEVLSELGIEEDRQVLQKVHRAAEAELYEAAFEAEYEFDGSQDRAADDDEVDHHPTDTIINSGKG